MVLDVHAHMGAGSWSETTWSRTRISDNEDPSEDKASNGSGGAARSKVRRDCHGSNDLRRSPLSRSVAGPRAGGGGRTHHEPRESGEEKTTPTPLRWPRPRRRRRRGRHARSSIPRRHPTARGLGSRALTAEGPGIIEGRPSRIGGRRELRCRGQGARGAIIKSALTRSEDEGSQRDPWR